MARKSKKLGELLVDYNYISENQLEKGLEVSKKSDKKIGEILVEQGFVTEEDLIQVLEFQRGIPHADLDQYYFDPNLAEIFPEKLARRYISVPIEKVDNKHIKVAMADPTDLLAIDDLERITGMNVEALYGAPSKIRNSIEQLYGEEGIDVSDIFDDISEDDFGGFETAGEDEEIYEEEDLREMVDEAPIIKLANYIISKAYKKGASDIHVEPEDKFIRVRYRIDGVMQKEMTAPKSSHRALVSRFKIIADLDITEHRVPQDGRIRMKFKGQLLDMRVSTLPTVKGEKVVIRLLAQDTELLDLDNLGFSEDNKDKFYHLINKPHGIMLLTGPTGSGKTTTLFASLNEIKSVRINMVTIEDPVEYQVPGIYQVQAKPKAGLTFAKTLRSILRQDPDVIMIGEMRDEETAEIAVRAALTGHLVFSTLHTNDAVSSITRLVDMGLPSYLVASSVNGVVAQRLVRRLCEACKEEREINDNDLRYLKVDDMETAYYAVGCPKCNDTGYSGRVALQEIFVIDGEINELIADGASEERLQKVARDRGMRTLKEDGIEKIRQGVSDVAELKRIIF